MNDNPFAPTQTNDETSLKESSKPKRGFTFVDLLVLVSILFFLAGLLLPTSRSVPLVARRMQCSNNLKQIALALHNYHFQYHSLPPAYTVDADGKRLHSWRTLILPFLEQSSLYDQIDLSKPWDDPVNAIARDQTPEVFKCPLGRRDWAKTTYLVVVDPNSCFPGDTTRTLKNISDDPDTTVLVFEASREQAVEWMSPQDADLAQFTSYDPKSPTTHPGGISWLSANGAVHSLDPSKTTIEIRRNMTTIAGGESVSLESP